MKLIERIRKLEHGRRDGDWIDAQAVRILHDGTRLYDVHRVAASGVRTLLAHEVTERAARRLGGGDWLDPNLP